MTKALRPLKWGNIECHGRIRSQHCSYLWNNLFLGGNYFFPHRNVLVLTPAGNWTPNKPLPLDDCQKRVPSFSCWIHTAQGWCVSYRITTWSHAHSTKVHPPLCSQDREENLNPNWAFALSWLFTSSTSLSSHFMMELVPGSGCCLHFWIDLSLQYWAALTIPLELSTFCSAFLQGALEIVLSSASSSLMCWSNQLKLKTEHSQKNLTVWILVVPGYLEALHKDVH